LAYNAIKERL